MFKMFDSHLLQGAICMSNVLFWDPYVMYCNGSTCITAFGPFRNLNHREYALTRRVFRWSVSGPCSVEIFVIQLQKEIYSNKHY